MIKKNLFMLFVFYFFVIQFWIAGLLWDQSNFYLLGGINFVAILLLSLCYSFFAKEKEPSPEAILVREKMRKELLSKASEESELPISESNIEYIKTKINRNKKPQTVSWWGTYRLLVFLLALVGFVGILYMFWDIFDFFAVLIWALGMMIFITVIFKAAHLWEKTIFASVYFWLFCFFACGGLVGLLFWNQYAEVEFVKSEISTFIDGLKGEWNQNADDELTGSLEESGFLFEETGEVLGMSLSGDRLFSWEQLSGAKVEMTGSLSTGILAPESPTISGGETKQEDLTKQVTMLEAIKHLIKENAIPLSSSKNVKFSYVAMSNEAYPYMKTALEKRMIGANTDPNMLISCDVYMVMKGLAKAWPVTLTADVKSNYWNAAVAHNALNGCKKGAKLTVWNL